MTAMTITPQVAMVMAANPEGLDLLAPEDREAVVETAIAVLEEAARVNLLASLASVRAYLAYDPREDS